MAVAARAVRNIKQVESIFSASSSLFAPSLMLTRGPPPMPTNRARAEIMVTMGPQTPTPARAISPIPSIFPIYILSTILYRTLTNWAIMLGMARLNTRSLILSLPRSFVNFILFPTPYLMQTDEIISPRRG